MGTVGDLTNDRVDREKEWAIVGGVKHVGGLRRAELGSTLGGRLTERDERLLTTSIAATVTMQ